MNADTDYAPAWLKLAGAGLRPLDNATTLRFTVFNSAASVRVRFAGRWLTSDGRVVNYTRDLVPTTDRVATTIDHVLGDGWLLSCVATIAGGAPISGQTYAVAAIGQGTGASFTETETLVSGELTAAFRLAWPGSPITGPLAGAGAIRTITGTTPGVGAEISETVPTGARWEILSFTGTLTTSATVASRFAKLTFDDGATIFFRAPHGSAQLTGTIYSYCFFSGGFVTTYADAGAAAGALPVNNRVLAAGRIRTITTNIQVGDQWSAVQYQVREWIEGA